MTVGSFLFPLTTQYKEFIACAAALSAVLVVVRWITGEPLRWRWGSEG